MVPAETFNAARPPADPHLDDAFVAFRRAHPSYDETARLDALRASEYGRLDRLGHVYLDYTGGGLYAETQVRQHLALLSAQVLGNPHSSNPTSQAATRLVEGAREYILRFFNAAPDEYAVIFTANASGALKIVGESYPFGAGSQYLLTFDNHNSVNGIREFALARGATVTYVPVVPPDLRADVDRLTAALGAPATGQPRLFAYPAQSNFSGVQHPLDWIDEAHRQGWDVLLDAAAFAPTNRLDLSVHHPDFVDLSFYKMFGYPTGIGCLIARKEALTRLRRPWYAGGTVAIASVEPHHPHGGEHYLYPGVASFEDGTVNYLGIPAVEIGLRYLEEIGLETIHQRVECLTAWLLENLVALRHENGKPLLRIHGPTTMERRGGTISMNVRDPDERIVNSRYVESRANERNISVRVGCHCNPGAGEVALGFSEAQIHRYFLDRERMGLDEFLEFIDERKSGAVRVSVGLASTFADVYRFVAFVKTFLDKPAPVVYVVEE